LNEIAISRDGEKIQKLIMAAPSKKWEGDLLSGPNNSYIATWSERHTQFT